MINQTNVEAFRRDGYVVANQLFLESEVKPYVDHYMKLRMAGSYPEDKPGVPMCRMVHMHRWDDKSLSFVIDQRLAACLRALTSSEPYVVQSMVYFKPPGALGQAFHQDQYYLRARPGTCVAAWMALDPSDEETGCLQIVRGSQDLPVLCTEPADMSQSHTGTTVPIPDGMEIASLVMVPGDVVFFNGSVIHGSKPNLSEHRYRRALVGHYLTGCTEQVAADYHPVLRMDGSTIELQVSDKGGPCGVWVDDADSPAVEIVEPTA